MRSGKSWTDSIKSVGDRGAPTCAVWVCVGVCGRVWVYACEGEEEGRTQG